MRPCSFLPKDELTYFGEVNENKKAQGRGIFIDNSGRIRIGYFENGSWSTDNYIYIDSDGGFSVGEIYLKDGRRW